MTGLKGRGRDARRAGWIEPDGWIEPAAGDEPVGRMVPLSRRGMLALAGTLAAAGALMLAGCGGPSIQDLLRDDAKTQLEALKTGAADAMVSSMEQAAGDSFDKLGVSAKDLSKEYLSGFDYTIDGVDVDEEKGTATVRVTFSCKSLEAIAKAFSDAYQKEVGSLKDTPTQRDLLTLAGKVMQDAVKNAKPAEKKIDLTYKKNDAGEWSLDTESANKAIAGAMA